MSKLRLTDQSLDLINELGISDYVYVVFNPLNLAPLAVMDIEGQQVVSYAPKNDVGSNYYVVLVFANQVF